MNEETRQLRVMIGVVIFLATVAGIITLWVNFVGLTVDLLWRGLCGVIASIGMIYLCLQCWVWLGIVSWQTSDDEE